ncbi:MAG TPA: hypothetical protein VFH44_11950 [Solirubrobacterales bacterium]|nr:hypothetical protein [Solirubrobacterales bacterium]
MASAKSRKRRKRRARAAAGREPAAPAEPAPAPEPGTKASRRPPAADERPAAPWGSFPLVELCVLTGIVMLILGFFVVEGDRGPILIAAGLALGSIGGLELSIREHFAGYRSHTVLLAGVPTLIVLGLLFYLAPEGLPAIARAAIGIAVFAAAAALLTRIFSRRSGGDRYRFSPLGRRR